ncbi:MAG: hypothetical protein C0404_12565 [Verrucomicrobia bacterium]|nr:hypothetical protein [Verrucomicrobiota bacterium]
MKKIRHLLEYAGMRIGLFFLDRVPLGAAIRVSHLLADAWFLVNRSRRTTAMENIRRAGIAQGEGECRKIARQSFRHFGDLVVESLKSDREFTEQNWRDRVEMEIAPEAMAVLNNPTKGFILVSGHFGNWEVAAQLLSFIKPVVGITRDMNNPYTDRLMKERKPRNRFRLTPKHDAEAGRFLSILKNGEMLALMIDQHARDRGMPINFFGTPAATHTSAALLHLVTGAALSFGYCLRIGPLKYRMVLMPPIRYKRTGNKEKDIRAIMEELTRHLEDTIRKNPEQYLWAHRRWRLQV